MDLHSSPHYRPKQGWMYGMLMNGRIGYFLEDHVTTSIDPIGDIKGRIQSGKAKVEQLPISGPTQVSHELHWGKNGEKWGETEKELTRWAFYRVIAGSLFGETRLLLDAFRLQEVR